MQVASMWGVTNARTHKNARTHCTPHLFSALTDAVDSVSESDTLEAGATELRACAGILGSRTPHSAAEAYPLASPRVAVQECVGGARVLDDALRTMEGSTWQAARAMSPRCTKILPQAPLQSVQLSSMAFARY